MPRPNWDKTRYAARKSNLHARARILKAIRTYFDDEGFLEVETPILQVSPGIDRHIRPIKASVAGAFTAPHMNRFLHTSPEFAMKKLLAAGERRIFQICHVFRDHEDGPLHHPEFTMLEWYRAGASYESLIEDVQALALLAANASSAKQFKYQGVAVSIEKTWKKLSIAEAFSVYAGIDLLAQVEGDGAEKTGSFLSAARQSGVRCEDTDSWDNIFHRVMLEKVEPALKKGPPIFLYDYPAPVGALARHKPQDPRVCERVEAYACGVELANGFSELTDAEDQRQRFERDRSVFETQYGTQLPIDEDFLMALASVPPSAGMALGIDRLAMLLTGAGQVKDVMWSAVDLVRD
ncbi:MAG: EF-P lysine aminoacylase EpmA [Rhodospirillaceae bacterium]